MKKRNKLTLVSIAMATYNGEKYIREQLDSILNQTYKNIELIITDDKSNDNTINIIKEYQKKDNRLKLYQNEINLDFVKNFEKAIGLCNGEYIALADQDDIWKLNKLEIFLDEIKENILIYSDAELIDGMSTKLDKNLIRPNKNLVRGSCSVSLLFYNCISGNTMMFKKELIPYILPIPESITFHDIWIGYVASVVGTITFTEENMIFYRRYSEQVTASRAKIKQSFSKKLLYKQQNLNDKNRNNLINYKIFLSFKNNSDEINRLLKMIINHLETFETGYFNINLYKYLKKNKDVVFAIKNKKNRNKYARKVAYKMNLNKITFFS